MEKEYPYYDEELDYWFLSGDLKTISVDDVDVNRLFVLNERLHELLWNVQNGEVPSDPNPSELYELYYFIEYIVNSFGEIESNEYHILANLEDED